MCSALLKLDFSPRILADVHRITTIYYCPVGKACGTQCKSPCNLWNKKIHCKVATDMLHGEISDCSLQWFSKIGLTVTKSRTVLYFMQSLPASKNCATACREDILHAVTQLAKKIASCNVTLPSRVKHISGLQSVNAIINYSDYSYYYFTCLSARLSRP